MLPPLYTIAPRPPSLHQELPKGLEESRGFSPELDSPLLHPPRKAVICVPGPGLCWKESEVEALHLPEGGKPGSQARGRRSQVGWPVWPVQGSGLSLRPSSSPSSPVQPRAILSFQRAAPCMGRGRGLHHMGVHPAKAYG